MIVSLLLSGFLCDLEQFVLNCSYGRRFSVREFPVDRSPSFTFDVCITCAFSFPRLSPREVHRLLSPAASSLGPDHS